LVKDHPGDRRGPVGDLERQNIPNSENNDAQNAENLDRTTLNEHESRIVHIFEWQKKCGGESQAPYRGESCEFNSSEVGQLHDSLLNKHCDGLKGFGESLDNNVEADLEIGCLTMSCF
jgi:hypothetical protein